MNLFYFPVLVSTFAFIYLWFLIRETRKAIKKKEEEEEIRVFDEIRREIFLNLTREVRVISFMSIVLAGFLLIFGKIKIVFGFLLGIFLGVLFYSFVIKIFWQLYDQFAKLTQKNFKRTLEIVSKESLIIGLTVISSGPFFVSVCYLFLKDLYSLVALGLGISLVSFFIRIKKDTFLGKPDKRNEFLKAIKRFILTDGSYSAIVVFHQLINKIRIFVSIIIDILSSYITFIITSLILSIFLFPANIKFFLLPLLISSVSILTFIIGTFFIKFRDFQNIKLLVYKILGITVFLSAIVFYFLILRLMKDQPLHYLKIYFSVLIGLFGSFLIFFINKCFVLKSFEILKKSLLIFSFLIIIFALILSFWLGGFYGTILMVISFCAVIGAGIGLDFYNLFTSAIDKIGEKLKIFPKIKNTVILDLSKNSFNVFSFVYEIILSLLISFIILFIFFHQWSQTKILIFSFKNYYSIISFLVGLIISCLFVFWVLKIKFKIANKINKLIKDQINFIKKKELENKEYEKYEKNVIESLIKEIILFILLLVLIPSLAGFLLGFQFLAGVLIGNIISAICLSLSVINNVFLWNIFKKYITNKNKEKEELLNQQFFIIKSDIENSNIIDSVLTISSVIKIFNIIALLSAFLLFN